MLCLVITASLILLYFSCSPFLTSKTKIVNLSITIGHLATPSCYDALLTWLKDINYSKFTFTLHEWKWNEVLNNATLLNALKSHGELIGYIGYMQGEDFARRRNIIDWYISNWTSKVGYCPKGVFMGFHPDTYTVNYCLSKGLIYVQGYCFDQYLIDYMSMRGGWQAPYYASLGHVLVPSSEQDCSNKMIIFPHNIWDWRASFEEGHCYNTHLWDVMYYTPFSNFPDALAYMLDLIYKTEENLNPFGYVCVQHEFDFMLQYNLTSELKNYYGRIIDLGYTMQMFNETAECFKRTYKKNPIYEIDFNSPLNGKRVEWYYSPNCRITRYDGNKIVGFINYKQQQIDKYLTSTGIVDVNLGSFPGNCFDNSLNFDIDSFGNGLFRAPSLDNYVMFDGRLCDFSLT